MARTVDVILTELQNDSRYNQISDLVNGNKVILSPEDRLNRLTQWANDIRNSELTAETITVEENQRRAIASRLQNNTATNDDRNKAILWLIRQLRPDV